LILAALQASAVDPKTGRIDLDLVTTGISARSRIEHEQKRYALRQLLSTMEKPTIRWIELYRTFQDQCDTTISKQEFMTILNELLDEGVVHVTGRGDADRVVIRKVQ
jgi:DNA replication licensing factor MCM4